MPRGVYERTEKMRERKMGHIVSEKTKEKMSESAIGKHLREENGMWKNGIKYNNGYVLYLVPKEHKFSCMKDCHGYIPIHRLTMAESLQRPLANKEVVHHINEDVTDNRIENLMLFKSNGEHIAYHNKLKKEMILV